jgi:acetyl esterase
MPLHPDIEAFLDMANAQAHGRPRMSQMAVPQARAAYERSTLALDPPGAALPVEALEIPARDGALLPARLYRGVPRGAPAATLLFFHGGGYVLGGLDSHDSLCRDLAQATPCDVLAVDYRLAPEYRFPTAFLDAQDALAWLRTPANGHGLDAGARAVGGDSVGGTLAAALCIAEREAGRAQPAQQLLLYPCTAARQDSESHRRLARGHLLEGDTLQWMFGHYLRGETDRLDWRFAPLECGDLSGLAPAHLALAEYDPLLDEGLLYARRLQAAGVAVSQRVHEGQVHDFARLGHVTPEAGTLRLDLARVLRTAFRRVEAGAAVNNRPLFPSCSP